MRRKGGQPERDAVIRHQARGPSLFSSYAPAALLSLHGNAEIGPVPPLNQLTNSSVIS
jgi:hypothetical protein